MSEFLPRVDDHQTTRFRRALDEAEIRENRVCGSTRDAETDPVNDHRQMSWVCPSCRAVITAGARDDHRDRVCSTCLLRPDWEALPEAVRDEVGAMLAAGAVEPATYRLRDLDENRLDTFDYVLMTVYAQGR